MLPPAASAPGTRFNGPVTAHRVLDAKFFDFAELKPMRDLVPGATVNDVALAVDRRGAAHLPRRCRRTADRRRCAAMTPVSVRTEAEKGDLGNQVSAMIVSLATDVADPSSGWPPCTRSTIELQGSHPSHRAPAT